MYPSLYYSLVTNVPAPPRPLPRMSWIRSAPRSGRVSRWRRSK